MYFITYYTVDDIIGTQVYRNIAQLYYHMIESVYPISPVDYSLSFWDSLKH